VELVELQEKVRISREDAAARLRKIADELATSSSSATISASSPRSPTGSS
jgi:hypothetical protein